MNSYSKNEKMNGKTKTKNSKRNVHMPTELAEELGDYFASLYPLSSSDVSVGVVVNSPHTGNALHFLDFII